MNEQDRLKSQVKLIEARDRCNWVITHLMPDLPYSHEDIGILTKTKTPIMYIHDRLAEPYPPSEPPPPTVTKTKYPLFDVNFMAGYAPWDLHALNLPYHSHFDRHDWEEGADLMRDNHVNSTRLFLSTGGAGPDADNRFIPFLRKPNGKFDLTKFGSDMSEIEWRLEKFWERDIATVICIASGIKGVADRFKQSVWYGRNNVNGTTHDHKRFMDHDGTMTVYKKVLKNLWERWKDKPVIFEFINEPAYNNMTMFNWYSKMMERCRELGIPGRQFAFEKWDSSKILSLLREHKCWCLVHGVNHVGWFKKWHRRGREMQKIYEEFDHVAADSDGHDGEFPGEGLVGKLWNPNFKRPAPKHIESGLIHDHEKSGAGWMVMSAGAYYKNPIPDRPNHVDLKHAAVPGLEKHECEAYGVDWSLFSYRKLLKRYPLGELVAIRRAMDKLFGE